MIRRACHSWSVPLCSGFYFFGASQMTFGTEFECFIPSGTTREQLAVAINARLIAPAHCAVEGYNHNARPHWKVITDGSLGDYQRGVEVVSPNPRRRGGHRRDAPRMRSDDRLRMHGQPERGLPRSCRRARRGPRLLQEAGSPLPDLRAGDRRHDAGVSPRIEQHLLPLAGWRFACRDQPTRSR